MGDPARRLSEEEELAQLLDAGSSPEDELSQLMASKPSGKVIEMPEQRIEGDPRGADLQDQGEHVLRMLTDAGYFAKNLGKTGSNYLGGAIGAAGEGAGVLANAGRQAVGAGVSAGTNAYLDDPEHSVLSALLEGGKSAGVAGATALGLGGLGRLAGAGSDRARVAAFGGDKAKLQELGVTPRELAARSDELGLNNAFMPMDLSDKRARIGGVLADRGQRQAEAIANADAQGIGANRDWGGEIARDVDQNADRVWTGGSGQREAIRNQMNKVAGAAEDHPMDTLQALREYKTGRGSEAFKPLGGLEESAAGKAALAGYDSASQNLNQSMAQSGDANYRQFTAADNDFHDAKLLEELTKTSQSGSPFRRPIGAAIGAGVGMAVGGPIGAPMGAMGADMTRGYHADAAANLGAGMSNNLGAASEMTGAASSGAMQNQREQTQQQGRGDLLSQATQMVLQRNPQALGQYAQQLQAAQQDGTLSQVLFKLQQSDPQFRSTIYPQLLSLTAAP